MLRTGDAAGLCQPLVKVFLDEDVEPSVLSQKIDAEIRFCIKISSLLGLVLADFRLTCSALKVTLLKVLKRQESLARNYSAKPLDALEQLKNLFVAASFDLDEL